MAGDEQFRCSPYLLKECRSLLDARRQIAQAHAEIQAKVHAHVQANVHAQVQVLAAAPSDPRCPANARLSKARPSPKAVACAVAERLARRA